MPSKAYFMVRAVVGDAALRQRFDRWYEDEHLPEAGDAFGCDEAMRFWSRTDPSVHLAMYGFRDLAAAERGRMHQWHGDPPTSGDRLRPARTGFGVRPHF